MAKKFHNQTHPFSLNLGQFTWKQTRPVSFSSVKNSLEDEPSKTLIPCVFYFLYESLCYWKNFIYYEIILDTFEQKIRDKLGLEKKNLSDYKSELIQKRARLVKQLEFNYRKRNSCLNGLKLTEFADLSNQMLMKSIDETTHKLECLYQAGYY